MSRGETAWCACNGSLCHTLCLRSALPSPRTYTHTITHTHTHTNTQLSHTYTRSHTFRRLPARGRSLMVRDAPHESLHSPCPPTLNGPSDGGYQVLLAVCGSAALLATTAYAAHGACSRAAQPLRFLPSRAHAPPFPPPSGTSPARHPTPTTRLQQLATLGSLPALVTLLGAVLLALAYMPLLTHTRYASGLQRCAVALL